MKNLTVNINNNNSYSNYSFDFEPDHRFRTVNDML